MQNARPDPHVNIFITGNRCSRRAFLLALSAALTGSMVAGCRPASTRPSGSTVEQPASVRILPSPQAPTPSATNAESEALVSFLALSTLLTGVAPLDPVVGRVYLAHLQQTNASTLTELYRQVDFSAAAPPTLQTLEAAGIFSTDATRQLTDQILELWYTGKMKNEQDADVVVTFVDALVWQALAFTKPPTICASPHFWATEPNDRQVAPGINTYLYPRLPVPEKIVGKIFREAPSFPEDARVQHRLGELRGKVKA